MKGFCAKCVEKEAAFEVQFHQMQKEIQALKERIDQLEHENDKLSLDLAFYEGNIINLSCNGK